MYAHQDGHAGVPGDRPADSFAEPAIEEGEGRQAEVRLGLAAAGGEEEEVDGLAIGVFGVDDPPEVEQEEGELEGLPLRLVDVLGRWPRGRATRRRAWRAIAALASVKARKALGSCSSSIPWRIRSAATPARLRSVSEVSTRRW